MSYNWQLQDWPNFQYQQEKIADIQLDFGIKSGQVSGLVETNQEDKTKTIIEMMVSEAIKTSEIEGEFLSRQEVMSSIKNNLGFHDEAPVQVLDQRVKGITQLMVSIRNTYEAPISKASLFR